MRSVATLPHVFGIRFDRFLAGCIAAGLFVAFAWVVLVAMPPIRSFARLHESLPTAVVEGGHTVYCRMRCCDFRFPLPSDAVLEHFDHVRGGFDTIDGSVQVTPASGTSLDMRAYAQLLEQHGFHAQAPDTCSLFASSTKPRGGSIQVSAATPATATIQFSYFGDY